MYTLRRSELADADFAYQAEKTTMRDFALQAWGVWLDEECKKAAIQDTKQGRIHIIEVGNENAGTLQFKITDSSIVLKQLYLLPLHQNRGIGREIITDLKRMSNDLLLPISLGVLAVNSAKEFYLKNGFTVESKTDERVYMRYAPNECM